MLTGELKNKVDSLWEIFWTGGLTNPLDVIEQITYLMFIHDLDTTDNLRAKESAMLGLPYESRFAGKVQIGDREIDGQQLKWSVFHDFDASVSGDLLYLESNFVHMSCQHDFFLVRGVLTSFDSDQIAESISIHFINIASDFSADDSADIFFAA